MTHGAERKGGSPPENVNPVTAAWYLQTYVVQLLPTSVGLTGCDGSAPIGEHSGI